jgi:predicted RNA-binding Zn ribbon-like protein
MVNTALVTEFVNSLELMPYTENLGTPAQLVSWLAEHGLAASDARATKADLEAARRLREAIRDFADGDASAAAELDRAARESKLGVRFAEGEAHLEPAAAGIRGALGRIVAEVAAGLADGTWSRLKICNADDCRWAFYDTTKNRSRAWCSMQSCGNRAKVKAYRARHNA